MDTVFSIIRKLDIFSVPYTFSLSLGNLHNKNKFFQQSLLGGLISSIIFFFSLVYGVILLSKWINYEMAFKIATQDKHYSEQIYQDYGQNNPYGDAFSLYVISNIEEGDIEYFDKDAIIYIPLLYNEVTQEVTNLLKQYDSGLQQIKIQLDNTLYESNLILFLVNCIDNQQFLSIDQTCADQNTYNMKTNYEGLQVNLDVLQRKLDYQTQVVQNIDDSYTFSFLQKNFSIFKFITIDYSFYTITGGLFQEQQSNYMLTTTFHVRESQGTTDYVTKFSEYYVPSINQVQAGFYLSLNSKINEVLVQYPSIAEVLANIGSITQTMLLIGILIRYMNRRWMIEEIKASFKFLFFPELSQIVQRKVGKEKQYFLDKKQLNKKNLQEFILTIDQKIEEKMNYENLIYEISRIQVILEEVTTHYKIFQSHKKKFELDLIYEKNNNDFHILNYWKSLELLDSFKKFTFAPFSLNFSTKELSDLMISNLQSVEQRITIHGSNSLQRNSFSQHLITKQNFDYV